MGGFRVQGVGFKDLGFRVSGLRVLGFSVFVFGVHPHTNYDCVDYYHFNCACHTFCYSYLILLAFVL